ncbi:hypothetical protein KY290_025749 [Solanum tuberosum]|uniref:NADH:quinone oxidoreductase/Mrp antiporter transmembrane domain-containing protein n=1 Tax=Solanum tuberosum TaxID=4113 RepID=A0ABQ7UUK5_SOLTU|nr:hypothetical protein KY285_024577 [Solanum tuberosum]KAH0755479.1 hypothetical protein KY290_025749 [Solanum tuberosum]
MARKKGERGGLGDRPLGFHKAVSGSINPQSGLNDRNEWLSPVSSWIQLPTHPICSMIYGSTGATHFDQLAKILTGYEITGARSSGIFMGILFIAVGSLFKITAVPFRAAVSHLKHYLL